jgi:hypothetical protein
MPPRYGSEADTAEATGTGRHRTLCRYRAAPKSPTLESLFYPKRSFPLTKIYRKIYLPIYLETIKIYLV